MPKTGAAAKRLERHEGIAYWRAGRAARYLDVSAKRIYQLVAQGALEAVRLGPRSLRVTRESLERYAAAAEPVLPDGAEPLDVDEDESGA